MSRELDSNPPRLGKWLASSLAVSFVVGVGLLVLPTLALEISGARGSLLAWVAMSVLAIPMIAVFARLGREHFRPGGITEYGTEALGEWSSLAIQLCMLSALLVGMPAMLTVTAHFAVTLFHLPTFAEPLIAHLLLFILCLNNLRPISKSAQISFVSVAVLLLIVAAVIAYNFSSAAAVFSMPVATDISLASLWKTSELLFFAFVGWESMSLCTRDLRNPQRDSSFVYWSSFIFVVAMYIALALVVSGAAAAGRTISGLDGILTLIPPGLVQNILRAMTVIILIANLNAWILSGARQIVAFQKKHLRPRHRKSSSSVLIYFVIASLLLVTLDFKLLSVADFILFCNQNWIVLYGGVLLFGFQRAVKKSEVINLLLACVAFVMLLTGFSWLIFVNAAYFVFSLVAARVKRPAVIATPLN